MIAYKLPVLFRKAMKMIEIVESVEKGIKDNAKKEVENLMKSQHPNIVKYFDHFDRFDPDTRKNYLCVIMEFCEVKLTFFLKIR